MNLGKGDTYEQVPFKSFYELQTHLGYSFDQMLELTKEHLKKGGYSLDDLKKALKVNDLSNVLKDIPYFYEVLNQNKSFQLYERATHVFSEAQRVYKFKEICEDSTLEEGDRVKKLGTLMNESHFSCKVLYECSSD
jgi:N-acetylgalactosamine kinase